MGTSNLARLSQETLALCIQLCAEETFLERLVEYSSSILLDYLLLEQSLNVLGYAVLLCLNHSIQIIEAIPNGIVQRSLSLLIWTNCQTLNKLIILSNILKPFIHLWIVLQGFFDKF